jgi:hypothetical protein
MSDPQWSIDPAVKVNCKDCSAECCKHIAVPIDEPKTWEEFEAIKWYISHENVCVYKDVEGDWLVECITKCGQLNGHRCMAWGTDRYPSICTDYDMKTCVMNEEGEYWEIMFKTAEDVDRYLTKLGVTKPSLPGSLPYPVCMCVPLDPPEEWKDYDDLRWYIAHRDVSVLCKDGKWFLHFNTLCRHKEGKSLCPLNNNHIPHDGQLFSTWEDIEEHCRLIGLLPEKKITLTLKEAS